MPDPAIAYSTVKIARQLLEALEGPNVVGLTFVERGRSPRPMEFFGSLEDARARISTLVRDPNTANIWVGSQNRAEADLETLLHRLSEERGFAGISTSSSSAKVFDIGLDKLPGSGV